MKIFPGMLAAGLLASTLYACQTQVVLFGAPAAPSNLAARSVSSSQLDLSWTDHAFNETGFELQISANGFFPGAFPGAVTLKIGGPNTTNFSHRGLGPIKTYWYRIKATNSSGGSAWSIPAFATTAPDGVAATPTLVFVNGQQQPVSGAIDVSWMPNSANTNISGYTVRYTTAAGSCKDRPVPGDNGSSKYTVAGLVPSKTYSVSVRADGGAYTSAFSAPANATTSPDGLSGTRISPLFFGQNAWLPRRIGDQGTNGDLEELLCGTSYILDGDLQGGPCLHAEVQESGVKLMRYGGSTVDNHYVRDDEATSDDDKSSAQYLTMVDNMRANGIEPLLEVPYGDSDSDYSATDAAELVRYINITHDRCVRYWTIANEPDHYESNLDLDATDIAADIAGYFKEYVTAMRDVDPTIVIVGPDLATYDLNDDPTNPTMNPTIMSELLTGGSDICGSYTGADGKTHYYLDVVDFHTYPFPNKDALGNVIPHMRQHVIDAVDGFQEKLNDLQALVGLCNRTHTRTGESVLKMAVTEINVEYDNDIDPDLPVDTNLSGVTAQSFLAGQYWAEVMNVGMKDGLEFMAFWSVKEGDPQIGYIAGNDDNTKLPTYYHYQMLAQNFHGVYARATSVKIRGVDAPNVKAFGAQDIDQIVVMLLNEQQAPALPLTYTVRLDTTPVTGNNALKVNIAAGVAVQYGTPAGGKLAPESTVMLVFDASGTLRARHVYGLSDASIPPNVYTH